MSIAVPAFAMESSIRADGTADLTERTAHGVVDVLLVRLGQGDVLQSEGVGLDRYLCVSLSGHTRGKGGGGVLA